MAWGQPLEGRIVHWTRQSVDQTLLFFADIHRHVSSFVFLSWWVTCPERTCLLRSVGWHGFSFLRGGLCIGLGSLWTKLFFSLLTFTFVFLSWWVTCPERTCLRGAGWHGVSFLRGGLCIGLGSLWAKLFFLVFKYSFGESLRRHAPVEPVSAGEPGAGPRAGKPKLATRL